MSAGVIRAPVMVTGAAGFVGRYVVAALAAAGFPASGLVPLVRPGESWNGEAVPVEVDMVDRCALRDVVAAFRPASILHLAAVSNPSQAARERDVAWETNFDAVRILCDACFEARPEARFLFVSSSEVYGETFVKKAGMSVAEDDPLRPLTPYAATKAAAEIHVAQRRSEGFDAVSLRPFNHSGPGQAPAFVISSFAMQIARIERGLDPPRIRTGNLDARRDFLDVRDVADAYIAALSAKVLPAPVYNIASGHSRRIGDMLDILARMSAVAISVETDPARWRPRDVPTTLGDASLAARDFGWSPKRSIDAMLADVLDEWRRKT